MLARKVSIHKTGKDKILVIVTDTKDGYDHTFDAAPAVFYKNFYEHLTEGADLLIKPEHLIRQIRIMELVHAQNPLPCTL